MDFKKQHGCNDRYLNEEEEDDDSEMIRNLKEELEIQDDNGVDHNDQNNGTIIMDADGNYYFQTSDKVVKVEPLAKVTQSPVKKVSATVVTSTTRRKATTAQPTSESNKKKKVVSSSDSKTVNEEVVEKDMDKTVISEEKSENQEEVYDFDENEQDADDPQVGEVASYETKGVVKNIKKSKTDEAYSCFICPYRSNKKFLLSRHMKNHSEERPYKCSVCERGFKSNASLMNHRNTHLGYKPHACKDCDKAFTTSGELVRHVRYRHTHIKPHKCTECEYSSVEMSKLRRHMRCHTGERPYQCPHCTYASPDTFKLKRHMRTHTGEKPYECDICHARFTQSNSLKHHRLIHSVNDKPVFQCNLCPTTCGRKTDLRLHIKKLHSSDQPIPCKRCGKELPNRYAYKMHVKTHEGEKCYRCEFCPYASISQRHLDSHVLIHLDAKPFVCEICQTSFRQKQLLTRHMKVYHSDNYEPRQPRKKDHKCPHCNKMFAFNGNLIRHMETHDPTSRLAEEKYNLKLGRLKRVQKDGTIVTLPEAKRLTMLSDEYIYEETEEPNNKNEEFNEQEYEEDYTNEDNVHYVYEEFEGEDYEHQGIEEEEEDITAKKSMIEIKMENIDLLENTRTQETPSNQFKTEDSGADEMSLEANEEQGFMVIEVLPDDDEVGEEDEGVVQTPQHNSHQVVYIKDNKPSCNETLASDYFGFEVDEEEDEDDEETKGAIKLLEIIEQE